MLHRDVTGRGDPVVFVHGFTQSGSTWKPITERLTARHTVVTIDAPGHGRSSEVVVDLAGGADLLAEAAPAPAAWIGYSMGGRFALHVALRHPEAVSRLVLVSTTAGIEEPAERASRLLSDEQLAQRAETEGLETFVRWWLAQPLFSSLPADAAGLASRLNGTAAGLASSLRLAGTGRQEPVWDKLESLSMPVLVLTGELDGKYTALGERIARAIGPNAAHRSIPGAGHACQLEQPEVFSEAVARFLADGS